MADKAYWTEPQKKAFTRWCNTHLKNRNITINDLNTDFKNGINLIHLLEILSSDSIKYNRTPRMEVQMMENLSKAVEFIKQNAGIKLVNIGPEDIYHGNERLILGLIWQLLLKYKISKDNGGEGSKELLEWVQRTIPEYNIKNFTTDWQSGKAICALAEAVQPGQMHLPRDFKNDPISDCEMGVSNAQKNMGIIALMDVEDIVRHPDQHAMMAYISYFRDREEVLKREKVSQNKQNEQLLEITPDLSKCIVYGPALEPGNEAGQETYFTIEVRNAMGRKICQGGHDISVRITGPHTQSKFSASDNGDGTYYVTFIPDENGNYVIEVALNHVAIGESPVHVTVNAAKRPMISKPRPYWFVQDLQTKKYIPYSPEDNQLLEDQFSQFGGGVVNLREYRVDLSKNEEINTAKKHIIHFITRPILRGTWYWQDDDDSWIPYDVTTATILERAFQEQKFNNNVSISDGKKVRYVSQFPDGTFRQYRQSKEARKDGRPVRRGYNGELILEPS